MNSCRVEAVVIGASAGAVEALSVILPSLPASFDSRILVVVHLPPDKESALVDVFRAKCALDVCEAIDKAPAATGKIVFAPPDYHLLVESDGSLSLSSEEPVHFSRPSIDVLFETAAEAYGERLLAILLTGASQDGAAGIAAVAAAGGTSWIQDPQEALVPVMPRAGLAACPTAAVMRLGEIATRLKEIGASQ
jgi:two-component system, chemotaxis family, protein-glutamate methylesterase/glutaminase